MSMSEQVQSSNELNIFISELEKIAVEREGKKYVELLEGCDTGYMYIVSSTSVEIDKRVEKALNEYIDGFGWLTLIQQNKLIDEKNGKYLLELETAKQKIQKVFEIWEERRKKKLRENYGKLLDLQPLTDSEKSMIRQNIQKYKELKKYEEAEDLDIIDNEKAIRVTYNFYIRHKDKIKPFARWDAERKIWKFQDEEKFEEIKQVIQQLKQKYEELKSIEKELKEAFAKRMIGRFHYIENDYVDEAYSATYFFRFKEDAELFKEFRDIKNNIERVEILGECFFRINA